jgi:hypothetical protein
LRPARFARRRLLVCLSVRSVIGFSLCSLPYN